MNRLGRLIAALAVLGVAAVSVIAVSSGPAVGKSAEIALPQYVNGYWLGDEPKLCILDLTYGEYPAAEAVAQYDDLTDIDLHVTSRMVACLPGEWIVRVAALDEGLPRETHGRWVRGDEAFLDDDGTWVHSNGSYIALNASIQDRATHEQWVPLIAHELGHALGLDHTNRQDSLMQRSVVTGDTVTETDVAVLNDLYSPSR